MLISVTQKEQIHTSKETLEEKQGKTKQIKKQNKSVLA